MISDKDPIKDIQTYQIEICYVCSKQLYTRCNGCKITYCSSECQENDSSDHKHRHASKNKKPVKSLTLQVMESRLPENILKGLKGESIQERLKRAVQNSPTLSEDIGTLPASSSMIDIAKESCVDEKLSNYGVDRALNKEIKFTQEMINNAKIKPVARNLSPPHAPNHKYETPEPIHDKYKDASGYFKVIVTDFDEHNSVHSVILEDKQLNIMSNQMIMNNDYESKGIPLVNIEVLQNYKSLIMAFVHGNWLRCKVIKGSEIIIKDIDSGREFNLTLGNFPLKYPLGRDLIVHGYAYRIRLVNVNDVASIAIGDEIKIRLLNDNYEGVLQAELFTETPHVITRNEIDVQRFKFQNMKVKKFPLGITDLMLVNGKNIKDGKIHVALASHENHEFYNFLYDRILDYIEENQDKNGYCPERDELVLVAYTDGDFYRAVCRGNNGNLYKFIFIDWGKTHETTPEDVWMIPRELGNIPVISQTVDLKLKSGKKLDKIDAVKTLYKLAEGEGFEGLVEMSVKDKYSVTIDDFLAVFEN